MPAVKKPFSRLPTNVVPVNYNIWLKLCLPSFTFDGKQVIKVQVKESTQTVTLNCAEINVSFASFTADNGTKTAASDISYSKEEQKVILSFPKYLPTGAGALNMVFKGEIDYKMKGLYRSRYKTTDGQERFAAVTQFEATYARFCFPCWDEPALKATFDATLVIPKNLVGLSNMNVVEEHDFEEDSQLKVLKYAQTPIMSTYLLAFVVGEYDYLEDVTAGGVKIRVYTSVGKSKQGEFALEVAMKALPFYKDYFGLPYPLAKLDLIAIADFCCSAMENWGLITYRETALLIDETSSSASSRQWVAIVVSHELAHQWFGNLVTMVNKVYQILNKNFIHRNNHPGVIHSPGYETLLYADELVLIAESLDVLRCEPITLGYQIIEEWWTHLWLNEGFATFMEYLATDHCHPQFDIWNQFITESLVIAMDLDALDNSHAIEMPVGHPVEVDEIFDEISYHKGASVIRMLHNWIGDESFRRGLNAYLTKHAYKNTITEDLWDALGEASGKPVRKVMTTWINKIGYPVLDVQCKSRTNDSITLTIRQSKFRANAAKQVDDGVMPTWSIPVSFSTPSSPHEPVKSILMEDMVTEVTIENVPRDGWVKVNPRTYGFYRVRYSSDLLAALLPAVRDQTLHALDRLALQSDIFALVSSGLVPTTDYFQTLEAYENETDYTVWKDVNGKVANLFMLLWNDDEAHENFKKFSLKLFKKIADKLGWEPKADESHLDSMLRSLVIGRMGKCGSEKIYKESLDRFSAHVNKSTLINADLRAVVYGNVLAKGEKKDFETMLSLHKDADLHEERNRIERSLGYISDDELMKKVLDFAMSHRVREVDRVFAIAALAMCHKQGRNLAWEFTKKNWRKFHTMYNGKAIFTRLVKFTTENFSDDEMAKDVEEFFEKNRADAAVRTVKQSLEKIRQKSDWWKRDGAAISEWLKKNA